MFGFQKTLLIQHLLKYKSNTRILLPFYKVYHDSHILVGCTQGCGNTDYLPRKSSNKLSSSCSDCHRFGLVRYFFLRDCHHHQPASLLPVYNLIGNVTNKNLAVLFLLLCPLTRLARHRDKIDAHWKAICSKVYNFDPIDVQTSFLELQMLVFTTLKLMFCCKCMHTSLFALLAGNGCGCHTVQGLWMKIIPRTQLFTRTAVVISVM